LKRVRQVSRSLAVGDKFGGDGILGVLEVSNGVEGEGSWD